MDLFSTLGLEPEAALDLEELERRYIEKSRDAHPDRFDGDAGEAIELQARINEAWRVLRDPWLRFAYLIELRAPGTMEATKRLDPIFLAEAMEAHEDALEALGDDARCASLVQSTEALIAATESEVLELLTAEDLVQRAATALHKVRYAQRRLEALRGKSREF